ncbi:hypothetical protein [uncultured Rikenella sp.]|uniref:hypothetical protein n=1 Tax=uncultured Rikenella sp. TaxID=368003 RepID=UPI002606E87D|nr:hypothetical protein [uncultured Rikenella sp.]
MGALGGCGTGGYSRSSTSYDAGDHYLGVYLNFGATWFGPSTAAQRAYGFQLRCLSE